MCFYKWCCCGTGFNNSCIWIWCICVCEKGKKGLQSMHQTRGKLKDAKKRNLYDPQEPV
ncbi:hypothetical protein DPEC_G00014720 [Dallia pectoralis]|uniref:Uncharacterized protein n=1 Tax=Dallia pectoralis TaxID=75939 RepID=A0ACC2HMY5_DALPE|nr:hypothetical protein DPEC_G00014720 [Dallia pectoralis]